MRFHYYLKNSDPPIGANWSIRIFQIVMEPQQTLQHDESQSIGDYLDDKIE